MPSVKVINEDVTIKTKDRGIKTLLDLFIENRIYIDAPCGGEGSCGKCLVKVIGEPVYKMACQTPVNTDMTVQIISSKPTKEKILVDGSMMELDVDPLIKKKVVRPEKLIYESESLDKVIERSYGGELDFSYQGYKQVSYAFADKFQEITLTTKEPALNSNPGDKDLVLNIEPQNTTKNLYGIAIDYGTTTAAGYLWDLHKGERVTTSSLINKQSPYGADVISRINHAIENEEGSKELQEKSIETVNEIIKDLCNQGKVEQKDIYQLSLVGNTTMNHLLLGFDPTTLGKAPYLPVTKEGVETKALELGIDINPAGVVVFLPNIAGFVGSDTIGAALASRLDENKKELLIDLGTNGEIVVTGNGKMVACSTAAGPAFEGAKIYQGMQASSGAISRVSFDNGELKYGTIANTPPQGICGSGLMDIMAILVRENVIDKTGRFVSPKEIKEAELARRVEEGEKGKQFIVAYPEEGKDGQGVYITQGDVREVQLAKSAIAAGIKSLLSEVEIDFEELEIVYLAGAFGNYVDVRSIQTLGVIPHIDKGIIVPMGNAAGSGCQMTLINKEMNNQAKNLVDKITHLELASKPEFQDTFMESMYFK